MSTTKEIYEMTMSLNVLNHLGIKLYSNIPSVLSEVVANAWDADAENVEIVIKDDHIVISDDGHGMTAQEINDRYLNVGFERRDVPELQKTPKHKRNVMGRKGIGKLSLFSIAKTIEVQTRKKGVVAGFRMNLDDIKSEIKDKSGTYHPTALKSAQLTLKSDGTSIKITELTKIINNQDSHLRKRLARRFSVISDKNQFSVKVNNTKVQVTDRDYFHKVQYLWYYGKSGEEFVKLCDAKKLTHKDMRPELVGKSGFKVSGWIGTTEKAGDLKDGPDNLNKIVIMVRGKLAQEDILEDFSEGGIYSKYLMGEIHADFLDEDSKDDIATSSRQEIIKDDPRYIDLKNFIHAEIKQIQNQWTKLRNQEGRKKAETIPAVATWLKSLGADTRKSAEDLLGKINELPIEDEEDRKELFVQSILAFETLRYRDNLSALNSISTKNLPEFAKIFASVDEIEASLFYKITKERIHVIDAMKRKVDDDVLEKVIQKYLYDHLWLLDPSWDRGTSAPHLEQQVAKAFEKVTKSLTSSEKKARFDIRYKTASGKHIIIELKKPGVSLTSGKLSDQVQKYMSALEKCLEANGQSHEPIEAVCIIGKKPSDWTSTSAKNRAIDGLKATNTRVLLYDELLSSAYKQYGQYLKQHAEVGKLSSLVDDISTHFDLQKKRK